MDETHQKMHRLTKALRDIGSVAVAFSGGVDSTFLLKAAHDTLGEGAIALTASFASFPAHELEETRTLAAQLGVRHVVFELDDLAIPGFADNSPNRCYLCKREILGCAIKTANQNGFSTVIEGSNADDSGDYRPGARAVREFGVQSPLRDAGLTKAEIRLLSKETGLSTWNKPACACLASRFAYGEPITPEGLSRVEQAETYLRSLGFSQVRVRVHGNLARIELPPEELALPPGLMGEISHQLKALGFSYATLDLAGYRTGSMNEVLDV